MTDLQLYLAIGLPSVAILVNAVAVLVGILINNSRLTDLRGAMDKRFDDMKTVVQSDLRRVEEVMDARLTRIEQEIKLR